MEDSFIIRGGVPLKGNVRLSGAKNVSLKAVIAALLFSGKVVLHHIPQIKDIFELLQLIRSLGAKAEFIDNNTVFIDGTTLKEKKLDFLYASKIRVSFLLFAPLLYRFGEAFIPNPGGCRIGARPIDRIVKGMSDLGIDIVYESETGLYHAQMKVPPAGTYTFSKPSHTGTEFMIMLSVFAKGKVVIHNAATEPEIDDLITFLNEGGAQIVRNHTDIEIRGVSELVQTKPYTIVSDRNEAVTYAISGIITKGDVTIGSIPPYYIKTFNEYVKKVGAGVVQLDKEHFRYYYKGVLSASSVTTDIHPGFMTDWQQNWAVLMTQANGVSIIHERVFENRFAFVNELMKIGAKIEFYNPEVKDPENFYMFNYEKNKTYTQAIKVFGPCRLHNGVMNITDLRAGATLVIAGLSADGESIVNGGSILERGYENIVGKITGLGGDIKKV